MKKTNTKPFTTIASRLTVLLTFSLWFTATMGEEKPLPETGISGVYEVMVGADQAEPMLEHFAAFGFTVVKQADFSAQQARALYGVNSSLRAYRLQNGSVDSHGLLRILVWQQATGPGVGYAPPETIGQRLAVMRTSDIFRIHDVFTDLRHSAKQAWLPTPPVYDELYAMDKTATYSISQRRVGVREQAVYGSFFNHVFFQRYGYDIPGYGTLNPSAALKTSEFTHHSFIIKGDIGKVTAYYSDVLGLKPEAATTLEGDWLQGPREVFAMPAGYSHWYQGFVSPNNVCGKLKFFVARDPDFVRDRSAQQRIGELGITLHSFFTPKLKELHKAASEYGLAPTAIQNNVFGEQAFVFTGPDGVSWEIIEQPKLDNKPVRQFELLRVNN